MAKELAFQNAEAFKKALHDSIGEIESVFVSGECLKIVCSNEPQAQALLQLKTFMNRSVTVTPPRSLKKGKTAASGEANSDRWLKGVIKRVPHFLTADEIKSETGAVWVHRTRLIKMEHAAQPGRSSWRSGRHCRQPYNWALCRSRSKLTYRCLCGASSASGSATSRRSATKVGQVALAAVAAMM